MKIHDLDPNRWSTISEELDAVADEIADPSDGSESDLVAAEVFRLVERASLLAGFIAAAGSPLTMSALRGAFDSTEERL